MSIKSVRVAVLASVFALLTSTGSGHAASFDCTKATSADEKAVCADPLLSTLDDKLAVSYREAAHAQAAHAQPDGEARQTALDFLADRHACGTDRACILAASLAALREYSFFRDAPPLPAGVSAADFLARGGAFDGDLPRRAGQCVATTLKSVTPRLGDPGTSPSDKDFDTGTVANLADGAILISYDREPALIAAHRGDPVQLCLVASPRRCPPGDDRGFIYLGTDERTQASWILPDSQHLCGGA